MATASLTQGVIAASLILVISACSPSSSPPENPSVGILHPHKWPKVTSPVSQDPHTEAQINTLLTTMTIEQKVAQMIQPEIRDFTVAEMREYGFGSYLNGGGAFPNNDKYASMEDWVTSAAFSQTVEDARSRTLAESLTKVRHGL